MKIFLAIFLITSFGSCKNCGTCPGNQAKGEKRRIARESKKMEKEMDRRARKGSF